MKRLFQNARVFFRMRAVWLRRLARTAADVATEIAKTVAMGTFLVVAATLFPIGTILVLIVLGGLHETIDSYASA